MNRLNLTPASIPPVPWKHVKAMRREFDIRIMLARVLAISALLIVVRMTFVFLGATLSPEISHLVLGIQLVVMLSLTVKVFESTGKPKRLKEDLQLSPVRAVLRELHAQYGLIARVVITAVLAVGFYKALDFCCGGMLHERQGLAGIVNLVVHDGLSLVLAALTGCRVNLPSSGQ